MVFHIGLRDIFLACLVQSTHPLPRKQGIFFLESEWQREYMVNVCCIRNLPKT